MKTGIFPLYGGAGIRVGGGAAPLIGERTPGPLPGRTGGFSRFLSSNRPFDSLCKDSRRFYRRESFFVWRLSTCPATSHTDSAPHAALGVGGKGGGGCGRVRHGPGGTVGSPRRSRVFQCALHLLALGIEDMAVRKKSPPVPCVRYSMRQPASGFRLEPNRRSRHRV